MKERQRRIRVCKAACCQQSWGDDSLNAPSNLCNLTKIAVTLSGFISYLFRLPWYVFIKFISEHLCQRVSMVESAHSLLTIYHMHVFTVCVCARVCRACHVHSLVPLILASPNLLCWTARMRSCWVWLQTACRAVPIQRCGIIYAWEKTGLYTCTPLICYTGRFWY